MYEIYFIIYLYLLKIYFNSPFKMLQLTSSFEQRQKNDES